MIILNAKQTPPKVINPFIRASNPRSSRDNKTRSVFYFDIEQNPETNQSIPYATLPRNKKVDEPRVIFIINNEI